MRSVVVLGLNFGDEGKGSTVDMVLRREKAKSALCVRFNGGHQAGHTVNARRGRAGNPRHVFSTFGAGTFAGAPTVISRFCTFSPDAMLTEYEALKKFSPKLYVDPTAPVCTFMDFVANRVDNSGMNMSVGVGFGTTLERNEGPAAKLLAADLLAPEWVLREKLEAVSAYYRVKGKIFTQVLMKETIEKVKALVGAGVVTFGLPYRAIADPDTLAVFEGAQGIQLDMDHGVFPYVTRSNTTSKNAEALLREWGALGETRKIYVSRTYLTRHGAGPFPEDHEFEQEWGSKIRSLDRTNFENPQQGPLRLARLDLELIKHSMHIDSAYLPDSDAAIKFTWQDLIPIPQSVASIKRKLLTW